MMRRRLFTTLMIAAAVAACSKDLVSTDAAKGSSSSTAPTGTDTSTTGTPAPPPTPPEPTSNGPVASVELSPKSLTTRVGYYGHIDAIPRDANGVRVANKRATWTSDDANIVIPSDTGIMYGRAAGTTTVRATIDGHTASATVTVNAAPADSTPTNPTSPTRATKFNLYATVVGYTAGLDTTKYEPIAGAAVHLTRTSDINGTALATPVDIGTFTSDAAGKVTFTNLDGGAYSFTAAPPTGSAYGSTSGSFGPPYGNIYLTMGLKKK